MRDALKAVTIIVKTADANLIKPEGTGHQGLPPEIDETHHPKLQERRGTALQILPEREEEADPGELEE